MENLSIKLENCFGIQSIDEEFSFKESKAILMYAPNGVMKTSLAKTFHCISQGKQPKELLYGRTPEYSIKIDGADIKREEILVVKPFDDSYESENLSTLLVNTAQKKIYDEAYKEILNARKALTKKLNKLSKVPANKIEAQIISDFGSENIFDAIEAIRGEESGNVELSNAPYAKIFDPKVLELLEDRAISENIHDYCIRYNELIERSPLYIRGKFSPVNAATVSKSLNKEKFFEAEHKVLMKGYDEAISDPVSLNELLQKESESILGDGELEAISKKIISGVAPVKAFQEILETHPMVSAYLDDLESLRKVLWSSYYLADKTEFDTLLDLFIQKRTVLTDIEQQASIENTLWHEAQDVFKRRFYVPFGMDIEDHKNAILGTVAPNMVFTFPPVEGEQPIRFDRGQLDSLDCLSVGERRAMYLLYVIFEFKARLKSGQRTVIVIDDIADSFDYKNKYAIVEYLKELAEEDLFRLIILTHNFDFYRTVQGRILANARWENSYIAQRVGGKINLLEGGKKDVVNPFEFWKDKYHTAPEVLVSMIPFIRTLVEYRDGSSSDYYKKLTSMLHIKSDDANPEFNSDQLKLNELEDAIAYVIPRKDIGQNFNKQDCVIDFIFNTANNLVDNAEENDAISLERKITLSIAIRLKAEEFMWENVADKSKIKRCQTGELFDRISREKLDDVSFESVRNILSQVTLMTPENIHLNSFMYEPLIDMSVDHLVDLFKQVSQLEWPSQA
ncbi:MAG: phage infection protein [Rickettsiales bacterium]|nr:phage infection protein [Rickettsiales bacterium]